METSGYATLSRQRGLLQEISTVANNIANASTSGYRQEGIIFSEYVKSTGPLADNSVSMAYAGLPSTSHQQGSLTQTNGTFDIAIEGSGFFQIETPGGLRLTRAGHFTPNSDGELVTPDGHRLLDDGGAPLFVPPDAGQIGIALDGTISAEGQPISAIGLVMPENLSDLRREGGVMFIPKGNIAPAPDAQVLQGFVEGSNVNPILQLSRMIEIQRAYELGQNFLDAEDSRIRDAVKTILR